MEIKSLLLVGFGGFLGSVGRYVLGLSLGRISILGSFLPATLLINVIGCLLIGVILGIADKFTKDQLLVLTTGFCGGFTTFSTFSFESMQLLQKGDLKAAFIYMFGSILLGLLFTFLGFSMVKMLS